MDRDWDESQPHGRKNSRPPGLRGKEIGLYYKQRARERNLLKKDNKNEPSIHIGRNISVPPGLLDIVQKCMREYCNAQVEEELDVNAENQFRNLLSIDFEKFIGGSHDVLGDGDGRSSQLDEKLKKRHLQCMQQPELRARYEARLKLPTMRYATEIIESVKANQVVLIVGSTGCGKTTQVPQLLLDDCISKGLGSTCRIICTQPRRISAITVAERVSYERFEKLGNSVGFKIRLESCKPRERGSITYCTTGALLQQMQSNPLLHDVSVLILDEIHERSVETDLLMGLLKKILPHRPSLKVILMSATVREQDFCDYFDNCPMFRIEGFMYPVEMLYLEDVLTLTNYRFAPQFNKRPKRDQESNDMKFKAMIEPYIRRVRGKYDDRVLDMLRIPESEGCNDMNFIANIVYYICEQKPAGAILIFMPGYDRISQLYNLLEKPDSPLGQRWRDHLLLYSLHSMLPTAEQQAVFQTPPPQKRKVIISTIIAETSVTIEDVVYVINTGRTKATSYDIETNIEALDEEWVTLANIQQRKGRAGRVRPGICYNLFSKAREANLDELPTPCILRCKLESMILKLKLLHIKNPYEFLCTLINAPQSKAISNGIALLKRIEALDEAEMLTPLGMHLAKLPIDPPMAKMILMSALFHCLDPITSAAAALSYKSPFYTPIGYESRVDEKKRLFDHSMHSDHLMVHNTICAYRESRVSRSDRSFCYDNFLSSTTLHQLERMKQQFADLLEQYKFIESSNCKHKASNANSSKTPLLRAIICSGLYPNMARLRKSRQIKNRVRAIHHMATDDGRRVNFHPRSVNSGATGFDSGYFVYFQRQKSNDLYLLDSTMVFPMALLIFGDVVETSVVENTHCISVAKTYYFKCDQKTASILVELREHLKCLLLKKALYPAPIKDDSHEGQLIKAIELLLSLDEQDAVEVFDDEIDDI